MLRREYTPWAAAENHHFEQDFGRYLRISAFHRVEIIQWQNELPWSVSFGILYVVDFV
jgi:hypothetical protein